MLPAGGRTAFFRSFRAFSAQKQALNTALSVFLQFDDFKQPNIFKDDFLWFERKNTIVAPQTSGIKRQ